MTDSKDLLFELGTEELPPVALKQLSAALTDEFVSGLDKANLKHGDVESYATPRRLAAPLYAHRGGVEEGGGEGKGMLSLLTSDLHAVDATPSPSPHPQCS